MFKKIVLAVCLAVSAAPAYAGGSMGSDVKVIVVNPTAGTMARDYLYNQRREREREARRAEIDRRIEARSAERERKSIERSIEKSYEKRLKAQRKARGW